MENPCEKHEDRSPKLITSTHESNTRVASLRPVITYRGIGDHVPGGTGDHFHWIAHAPGGRRRISALGDR